MENNTEEIDVYELAERLMASQSIEASVWLIKEYASQEREKGVIEGFNAAREVENTSFPLDYTPELKYPTKEDYLNSKNKP